MHHNPCINYNILDEFRYQQFYLGARQGGKSVLSRRYENTIESDFREVENYWLQFANSYPNLVKTQVVTRPGAKVEEYKPVNLDDYL